MYRQEIEEKLKELGIPIAYRQFTEETAVPEPYLVWYFDRSDNFGADDGVYCKIYELDIELYTGEKDFELEEKIEEMLDALDLFWQKEEQWLESEHLYEVLYYMEVDYAGNEEK